MKQLTENSQVINVKTFDFRVNSGKNEIAQLILNKKPKSLGKWYRWFTDIVVDAKFGSAILECEQNCLFARHCLLHEAEWTVLEKEQHFRYQRSLILKPVTLVESSLALR